MDRWKVYLKHVDIIDKKLELYDAKTYFGGYLKIKRTYFNALIKSIKMTKKYFTSKAIERVLGPDDSDWTLNPWMLIILKENEKKMPFWLLIKREKDLTGDLVAIGPKQFAEYNNKNLSEARREIKQLINYAITYLNKFNCVVFLPTFLT